MNEPLTADEIATPPYDLEAVYDAEIAPLMVQILEICKREKLPFVASFAYRCDDAAEYDLCSSSLAWPTRLPNTYRQIVRMLFKQS